MTSNLRIRPFELADTTACCWIINANVAVMDGLNEPARRLIIAKNLPDRLGLELSSMYTVIAEENDEVLGLGALDGTELKRFHVAQPHQRRGIGGAILMALEERARQAELPRLELLASPSAARFYESYGYTSFGEDRATSGNAEFVNVRMEKRL